MVKVPDNKPLRLPAFNYSQAGGYYVTICTKDKQSILWDESRVAASFARPPLSNIGEIIDSEISVLSGTYENLFVDKHVVMPNHIHLLIKIESNDKQLLTAPTVSRAIQQFKGSVTKKIGYSIWQ